MLQPARAIKVVALQPQWARKVRTELKENYATLSLLRRASESDRLAVQRAFCMPPPQGDFRRPAAQGVLVKPIAGSPKQHGVQARDANQPGRAGAPPVYWPQNPPAQIKPGSGPTNSVLSAAPPVYRPVPAASQPKTAPLATLARSGAPPVYRPSAATSQLKPTDAPPVYRPTAKPLSPPPVFRPSAPATQMRLAAPPPAAVRFGAPPVYRPQNPPAQMRPGFGPANSVLPAPAVSCPAKNAVSAPKKATRTASASLPRPVLGTVQRAKEAAVSEVTKATTGATSKEGQARFVALQITNQKPLATVEYNDVSTWGSWYFANLEYQDNKTGGWHANRLTLLPGAPTEDGEPTRYIEFRCPGASGEKDNTKLERCIYDWISERFWPNAHYDRGYVEITGVPQSVKKELRTKVVTVLAYMAESWGLERKDCFMGFTRGKEEEFLDLIHAKWEG